MFLLKLVFVFVVLYLCIKVQAKYAKLRLLTKCSPLLLIYFKAVSYKPCHLMLSFNPDCNATIKTPSARITSPGFPREYPHDTVCVTKLRSDVISSYLVRFVNFTLEDSENCTYDSVRIYPGTTAVSNLEHSKNMK